MSRPTYLDHNASTPVRPAVIEAMAQALAQTGNPSSVHRFGRLARRRIEEAREAVAALAGANPAGVVFTSGGTEANALALRGCGRERVLVSAVEHDSVLKAVAGAETIAVDAAGRVLPEVLAAMLEDDTRPAVVSVMLANNETGVVQPVTDIAAVARHHGALVHCDAVQAAGRIAVDIGALGVDMLTLSAHKLGGPQGVGALVLADAEAPLTPNLPGGGQERSRRAGTENVPGIVGFGEAARAAAQDLADQERLRRMRDRLEGKALAMAPRARAIGAEAPRLPNTSCLALPGAASGMQVMRLDLAGVAVSAGAACSSGKVAASHVLRAMGLPGGLAECAIRISFGWNSEDEDVERFLRAWAEIAQRAAGRGASSATTAA